jgi:PAS domain-containing protein
LRTNHIAAYATALVAVGLATLLHIGSHLMGGTPFIAYYSAIIITTLLAGFWRGETVEYESQVHFNNVGLRRLHVSYSPELDASGKVQGWIASILDITEQKRAEQRIAVSHLHPPRGHHP